MPPAEIAESGATAIPPLPSSGYGVCETDTGETVRAKQGISAAQLRAVTTGAEPTARILRVVVVEMAATLDLAPYLVLSDRPGWLPIALRRHEGVRAWGDLRNLRNVLSSFGYSGRLHVVPQGDPLLARLGIE